MTSSRSASRLIAKCRPLCTRRLHERLDTVIVGGTHPYAASMAVFCHLFANGMLAWLDLLEKLAGPLPFITRERLLTNDVDALRASLAHDRPDLSGGLAGGRLPQLFAGAADPDYPRIQQVARELTTRFVTLDGLNHFQAYLASDQVAAIMLNPGAAGTAERTPQRRTADATPVLPRV